MDQHDPERRVGQPPKSRNVPRLLAGLFGAIFYLGILGFFGYHIYAYHFGTPTTATIDNCPGYSRECTAVWSIGGNSSTGDIVGHQYAHSRGTAVDVRVFNGSAYTADEPRHAMTIMLFIVFIGGASIVVWWVRKRIGRSDSR
jgi:hypothetical protein